MTSSGLLRRFPWNAFENAFEKKWQGQFLGLWNIWIKQPFKIRFFCNN